MRVKDILPYIDNIVDIYILTMNYKFRFGVVMGDMNVICLCI